MITKQTIIGDILDMDRTTAPYFLEMGMHCLGCPSARGETLEQACAVHGVDADELVAKINAHLSKAFSDREAAIHLSAEAVSPLSAAKPLISYRA